MVELQGCKVVLLSAFSVSLKAVLTCIPTNSFVCIPASLLGFALLTIAILTRVMWYFLVVLIWVSLMVMVAELLFNVSIHIFT